MSQTDYKALCEEIFGTDDAEAIRNMARTWKRSSTRNAGRKNALSDDDLRKIDTMLRSGAKVQELAEQFHVSRQRISQQLNERPGDAYTLRMDYKHGNRVCTVIYVDFLGQHIVIQNRTDDILMRAFGANDAPTWNDFERFLEDRCFPKSRGYAKQLLRGLGIDSYDPLAIVEATGGRTAEDNMYLTFRSFPREVNSRA